MAESRPCQYCDAKFIPDPRVGKRQKACFKKSCQKQRRQEAQEQWLVNNSDAFKGRYANTKEWLLDHPGFLKDYRADHPEYVEADNRRHRERRKEEKWKNADIQDERLRRRINAVRRVHGADIQDEIRLKIAGILDLFDVWPTFHRADIQDSMARATPVVARSSP